MSRNFNENIVLDIVWLVHGSLGDLERKAPKNGIIWNLGMLKSFDSNMYFFCVLYLTSKVS